MTDTVKIERPMFSRRQNDVGGRVKHDPLGSAVLVRTRASDAEELHAVSAVTLTAEPKNGPLMLFYKVGPSPSTWWGLLRTSDDDGQSWSEARRLPDGFLGPVKNKPVELANGDARRHALRIEHLIMQLNFGRKPAPVIGEHR